MAFCYLSEIGFRQAGGFGQRVHFERCSDGLDADRRLGIDDWSAQ